VRLYRDHAVVLRLHKLGEADRIVTLLTREHGVVRAVAKGVRRTRSKFGARLEPFEHIDVQLYPGRNLDIITQVQTVDAFSGGLVADYGRYTTACAVLETAERLASEERAPVQRLHLLTVGALRARARGARAPARGGAADGRGARPRRSWCSMHSCCVPWRSPGGNRRFRNVPAAGHPVRTGRFTSLLAGRCAYSAGRPEPPPRRPRCSS